MKKELRTMIILMAVLLVLIAAYFGVSAWNTSREEAETKTAEEAVISLSRLTDITSISFEYQGEVLNFTKSDNGVWQYADDSAFPLDESLLSTIESTLSELDATRSFDNEEGYAAYGLEEPVMWITAQTSSGESFTLNIGNVSGSGYYAYVQGDDLIYTVSEELVNSLSYSLLDMAVIETIPALSETNILSISLLSGGTITEITKDTQVVESQDDDESDAVNYIWYLQLDGEAAEIPSDNASLEALISDMSYLYFDSLYAFNVDSDTIASCSLDDPAYTITVKHDDGAVTLKLGGTDENGNFYAMLNDSPYIYILSSSLVSAIVNLEDSNVLLEAGNSDGIPS